MRHFILALLLACGGSSTDTDDASSTDTSGGEHPHGHAGHDGHGEHVHPDHGHHHGHHHDFSDVERFAAIFDAPERDAWQKPNELVGLMGVAEGATVADLGAGTGYFLRYLSQAVGAEGRVIALDVEEAMVVHMRERIETESLSNAEARTIPTDDPGLEAESVDAILIVNTWHHIADRAAYAAKLKRALRPNGTVWVVDFTRDAPEGPPPEMRLDPETVVSELVDGGFGAEVVEETLPRQYVIRARYP